MDAPEAPLRTESVDNFFIKCHVAGAGVTLPSCHRPCLTFKIDPNR